jgi:hypothetical protein
MKYTREILEPIVKESISISEVCRKLGIPTHGGSNSHVSRSIDRLGIDRSHFLGRGHAKGKTIGHSYPIEEYLTNKRKIHSHNLKKRLISEGFKSQQCEECLITHWRGVQLSLELHHIDCNHNNNEISNLLIVCPNCHWVLHNSINQNNKESKKQRDKLKKGPDKRGHAKPYLRKTKRPDYEVLLEDINKLGFSATGRKYGVSDNAIRKWIKIYQKYGK